jgi:hypothetical protein
LREKGRVVAREADDAIVDEDLAIGRRQRPGRVGGIAVEIEGVLEIGPDRECPELRLGAGILHQELPVEHDLDEAELELGDFGLVLGVEPELRLRAPCRLRDRTVDRAVVDRAELVARHAFGIEAVGEMADDVARIDEQVRARLAALEPGIGHRELDRAGDHRNHSLLRIRVSVRVATFSRAWS